MQCTLWLLSSMGVFPWNSVSFGSGLFCWAKGKQLNGSGDSDLVQTSREMLLQHCLKVNTDNAVPEAVGKNWVYSV